MLSLFIALLSVMNPLRAEEVAPPSGYQPSTGEEFFLLSETSYSSSEIATVRVEAQRSSAEIAEYGGIDIAVYRVPEPLAFLKAQTNLHRIRIPAKPQSEGMANMLKASWDKIWANARFAWRRIFSSQARQATTDAVPQLKTPETIRERTRFSHPPAYGALPGLRVVDRFRYPLHLAKPVEKPELAKLEGSSSEFIADDGGNIRIPIGKREPGLYLVEAFIGKYRAVTLVFVSDSVAVTKNATGEMLVWTADRATGTPAAGSDVVWSDGIGVLKSGKTGADGVARLVARSPETSYVYGADAKGGVFISENFYHDSEIYNAKIYAVTDRPLYRPGDLVQVKFLGREFKSARESVPVTSGEMAVTFIDPAGTEIIERRVPFDAAKGGDVDFRLPPSAQAGGWEIVFSKGEDRYGAAFRVAEYVKPHFEIDIQLDKPEYKTHEAVSGRIRLLYPDGSPVAGALIRLNAKAQPLAMVDGELRYGGQLPLAIKADELTTGKDGSVTFSLPAANDPSRYVLSLLAQDGAAYRVRGNKEILIERGATLWQLAATSNFTHPGEEVAFRFTPQGNVAGDARPARWETLRLEDRKKQDGAMPASGDTLKLPFAEAGSYTVSLRDAKGNLLAATPHWVSGDGMKAVPGDVEIVFDKERYQAGETAQALITFPHPVAEALLTLERDKVEAHALLSGKADWINLKRLAPAQWRAEIKVREEYSPNMTFSVLYLDKGDYVFQNKGLRVATPAVEVNIHPARERYAPGETVDLEIETRVGGKPVPAQLTLGVVDEMIYVLQPEIAPTLGDFFYHPRRNNVRTAVSLSFIGYDLARMPGRGTAPTRQALPERGVKVLERPRRDDTDTAGWWPNLATGADGKVKVSFRMPDALTRWRITARAMTTAGVVGQQTRHVESNKSFYAKWTGPNRFRVGDQPGATLMVFNQTGAEAKVDLAANGGGLAVQQTLTLRPGANSVPLPLAKPVDGDVDVVLRQSGKEVDRLHQAIAVLPQAWLSDRVLLVTLEEAETPFKLPDDARDVRVSLAQGANGQLARIADDLVAYPWGCVEQTSSRLLPLAMAVRGLPADSPRLKELTQVLSHQRLRLVEMAGPQAVFGWWGNGTADNALLTAYAYYADWHASRALGLQLPASHWANALEAYTKHSANDPLSWRALSVWFMQEMNLPVKTLVEGLAKDAGELKADEWEARNGRGSVWFGEASGADADAYTLVLIGQLARQQQVTLPAEVATRLETAREIVGRHAEPLAQALLAMEGKTPKTEAAHSLSLLGPGEPTFDRALALAWWSKALGSMGSETAGKLALQGNWKPAAAVAGEAGTPTWRWSGKDLPSMLRLDAKPTAAVTAFVGYRSATQEKSRLPVTIERKLYRMVAVAPEKSKTESAESAGPGTANKPVPAQLVGEPTKFSLEPVKDDAIRSNELYLEEIRLTAKEGSPRFGLLEVPLPPGADVERSTWGIRLAGGEGEEALPIERARSQSGDLSYAVPVDSLHEPRTIRHLLRFGSRGHFVLPPARFYRMYQPEEKAFESVAERHLIVK